jgi:hypothetical protein
MPREIDQEKIEGSELPTLDINNPPTKNMPYQAYPKVVYLHPKDKTKVHLHKIVKDEHEHEVASKQGYKDKPHVPVAAVEDHSKNFEVGDYETETKRGPGRPPNQN